MGWRECFGRLRSPLSCDKTYGCVSAIGLIWEVFLWQPLFRRPVREENRAHSLLPPRPPMAQQLVISQLMEKLGESKATFLARVEATVESFIAAQGVGCLGIVARNPDGTIARTYRPVGTIEYARCLKAFCLGSTFEGRPLDSGLTEPVVQVVVSQFEALYEGHTEDLSKALFHAISSDNTILHGIAQAVIDSRIASLAIDRTKSFLCARLTKDVSERACALVAEQFRHYAGISIATGSDVAKASKQVIWDAGTVTMAKTIALVLFKMISVGMGPLIVKILSTAAFKALIVSALKKYVAAAIAAAILKFISIKFGVTLAAAWFIVLIPLVLAILVHEAYHFPPALAAKVASRVRAELDTNYDPINASILEKLFDDLPSRSLSIVANGIVTNPELIESVDELLLRLSSNG